MPTAVSLCFQTEESIVVAIKIFEQFDSVQPSSATELAKNYADMRYELNKLSTLKHAYIVRFVGVFTNPLCFVLEWAPERSLEHIRQTHAKENQSFCPTSLFLVLLQVRVTYVCTYILTAFLSIVCFTCILNYILACVHADES